MRLSPICVAIKHLEERVGWEFSQYVSNMLLNYSLKDKKKLDYKRSKMKSRVQSLMVGLFIVVFAVCVQADLQVHLLLDSDLTDIYGNTVTLTDGAAGTTGFVAGNPVTVTFEAGSFAIPQTVQVLAVDDSIDTGNRVSVLQHSVSSGDTDWDDLADQSLSVYINDNDPGCGAWGFFEMDFDEDCYVDLDDFVEFSSQWLNCTNPSDASCVPSSNVVIVAHRGYSSIAPENTIASCNAARYYAGAVEFDVRTTSDQQLVLMHDATVDRTTDGVGSLAAMTFSAVRSLDAGLWFSSEFTGELVPKLNEAVLAVQPDMIPCIERKSGTAQQYVDTLAPLRCADNVVIISSDWDFLADIEALDPTIVTGALGSNQITVEIVNNIVSKGIDFVDWSHGDITVSDVNLVHNTGLELWVWTVNDMNRVGELIGMGVDGITTDDPEGASQVLGQ